MDSKERAILKTLLYAEIFDYPLKKQEIFNFLISDKKTDEEIILQKLSAGKTPFKSKKGYFFIKGKEGLVELREKRGKASREKLSIAKKIIKKVNFIPSIKFVGISGALSMKNSQRKDDIDIFVISEKKLIWTTRFFLIVVLSFLGVYRKRKNKNVSDKICLNMIVDEKRMRFLTGDRNLYTAHEIAQLLPVIDKDDSYQKFVRENVWIKNYLPNAFDNKINYLKKRSNILDKFLIKFFKNFFLEEILKFIQLKYMKNHITKEKIKEGFLGFHPFDYKTHILNSYKRKLKEHGLDD